MTMDLVQNAKAGARLLDDSAKGAVVASFDSGNKVPSIARNTLARTDTSAKNLFTLPANAVPIGIRIQGQAVSNAGTTATLSVGKTGGTGSEYLSGFDVKGSTGSGQQYPTAVATGLENSVGTSDLVITGIYAETGTASTAGGPWTVTMEYILP